MLPFVSWEALGRNAAPLLEHVNAVVIAGHDSVSAASFALGIARVQGSVRRVAIADLVGEVAPLQSLVVSEDAHGISDSFLYGVSLNKIAQPLENSGNVFLMPSGTEPVATEAVYTNERWRKLAAGFHQVGALLLVVARPETPGFADLCGYVGAVFPMGDPAPVAPVGVPVIALPRPTPREVGSEDTGSRRRRFIAAGFATIAIALIVGILWPQILDRLPESLSRLLPGRPASASPKAVGTSNTDSAKFKASNFGTVRPTDANVADTGIMSTAAGKPGSLVVANPGDSAKSAAYAVYLVAASTRESAIRDSHLQTLPAVAISPVILGSDSVRWFRITVGASEDEASAEALIARLRTARVLGRTSGSVIRVPFAFRLAEKLSADRSTGVIDEYAKKGVSAYALRQSDGGVSIYTGAVESVEQASFLADLLRSQGISAVLVYRTGRAF